MSVFKILIPEPHTGYSYVPVVVQGCVDADDLGTLITCWDFCVVTGAGYKSANLISYDLVATKDVLTFIGQQLAGEDVPHTVSCYPASNFDIGMRMLDELQCVERGEPRARRFPASNQTVVAKRSNVCV